MRLPRGRLPSQPRPEPRDAPPPQLPRPPRSCIRRRVVEHTQPLSLATRALAQAVVFAHCARTPFWSSALRSGPWFTRHRFTRIVYSSTRLLFGSPSSAQRASSAATPGASRPLSRLSAASALWKEPRPSSLFSRRTSTGTKEHKKLKIVEKIPRIRHREGRKLLRKCIQNLYQSHKILRLSHLSPLFIAANCEPKCHSSCFRG